MPRGDIAGMSTLESLATAGSAALFLFHFPWPSWPHHTAICTAKCLELGLTIHRIVLALGVVKVLKDKFCSQARSAQSSKDATPGVFAASGA